MVANKVSLKDSLFISGRMLLVALLQFGVACQAVGRRLESMDGAIETIGIRSIQALRSPDCNPSAATKTCEALGEFADVQALNRRSQLTRGHVLYRRLRISLGFTGPHE